jgi:hypothetical protein
MAERLFIHPATLSDDPGARTVEFSGEIEGERYDFTLHYDVIEALDGTAPDDGAIAAFNRHRDAIAEAATRALARDPDQDRVTVSENDLA